MVEDFLTGHRVLDWVSGCILECTGATDGVTAIDHVEQSMDKPAKRAKTLDTHNGMDELRDVNEAGNGGSARKRASTGGGSGSSQKVKKAVVVENPG